MSVGFANNTPFAAITSVATAIGLTWTRHTTMQEPKCIQHLRKRPHYQRTPLSSIKLQNRYKMRQLTTLLRQLEASETQIHVPHLPGTSKGKPLHNPTKQPTSCIIKKIS